MPAKKASLDSYVDIEKFIQMRLAPIANAIPEDGKLASSNSIAAQVHQNRKAVRRWLEIFYWVIWNVPKFKVQRSGQIAYFSKLPHTQRRKESLE